MKTITFETMQDNSILYYIVSFDEEKIDLFCEKLKKEACRTIHYDYKALHGPYDSKVPINVYESNRDVNIMSSISNFKKTPVLKDNEPGILSIMYRYEYDVQYYPYLLVLIQNMTNGDKNAFFEIMYPTFKKEYIPLREEISGKERHYLELNEKNAPDMVERKLQLLDELKEMLLKIQSGNYEIPVRKYYEEAQQLLTVEQKLVDKNDLGKNR